MALLQPTTLPRRQAVGSRPPLRLVTADDAGFAARAASTSNPPVSRLSRATVEPSPTSDEGATASIIIPAHQEETNIARLLEALTASPDFSLWRVVVVVNGSTDATRSIAQRYVGVTGAELARASKIAALNEGDRIAGDLFPRLYVDADVTVAPGTIEGLIRALDTDAPAVASPPSRVAVSASSWAVRAFYRALDIHPVVGAWRRESMGWRRIYGANAAARARFGRWPDLLNDDGFFESIFAPDEKSITLEGMVSSNAPTTLRGEFRRQMRIERGNRQLDDFFASSSLPRHRWRAGARRPSRASRLAERTGTWLRVTRRHEFWRGAASGLVVRALVMRVVRWRLRHRRAATIEWS